MTGSDWELLEAAAKAAGIEYGVIHNTPRIKCDAGWTPWNPLTDDGDALRLAVKLKIEFNFRAKATWYEIITADWYVEIHHEPHKDDPYAATRRAIVCAAAKIGKNIP